MEITITLPDTVEVSAGEYVTDFRFDRLSPDALAAFVAQAACIGIAKAGNDSASGAKAYAEKHVTVPGMDLEKARETLIEKWIAARYAAGSFDRTAMGLSRVEQIAREQIRAGFKASKAKAADYKAADTEGKTAMVEAAWDGLSDDARASLIAWATEEAKERAAESARKAARLKAANVAVKL